MQGDGDDGDGDRDGCLEGSTHWPPLSPPSATNQPIHIVPLWQPPNTPQHPPTNQPHNTHNQPTHRPTNPTKLTTNHITSHKIFGIPRENIDRHEINLMAPEDIVPMVDRLRGMVLQMQCAYALKCVVCGGGMADVVLQMQCAYACESGGGLTTVSLWLALSPNGCWHE